MTSTLALPEALGRTVDVVGLGESSVDLVAELDGYPQAGSKQSIQSLSTLVGGQVATALVACARLDWRARYIGCLGADSEAATITDALTREGFDLRVVRREGHRSRSAIIIVDRKTGGRTVLEHRDPALSVAPSEIAREAVTSGRVLLIDATDPGAARAAAAMARSASVPVVLDIEHAGSGASETAALLRSADVVIAAESFPVAYTGMRALGEALVEIQRASGAALVVATLGAEGSIARCGGIEIRTPGFRVAALDTTGAGDAFRGGFIAGWLQHGPAAGVDTLLEYANAVAALNCRRVGAQTGLPTRGEVAAFVTAAGRGKSK